MGILRGILFVFMALCQFTAMGAVSTGNPSHTPLASGLSGTPADSTQTFRLPTDPLAGRRYNGSFTPEQTMDGDPSLQRYSLEQNLNGERQRGRHYGETVETEFTFYFRRNKTDIDLDYLWNREQGEDLQGLLERNVGIDSIAIFAWASPEGDYRHNVWLSDRRTKAARQYLLNTAGIGPERVFIRRQEENWPGLAQAVNDFYAGGDKEQILHILRDRQLSDQEKELALRQLDEGRTFEALLETVMKPLRSAVIVVYWRQLAISDVAFKFTPEVVASLDRSPLQAHHVPPQRTFLPDEALWKCRTVVAWKTNALYDAVTALNYAVEVPVGEHFSVQFEHYFPWWATKKELKYCLQYLQLGGEFRWWFAPRPQPASGRFVLRDVLTGHYLGLYGFYGKTDLQWERQVGMYQCHPVLSAGLTYGYSFPLTRHWNMELSVSAGYARIPYQHYIPSEDWQILWRDRENQGILHYFGPTQVKVSLVRPILIRYRVK